MASYFNVSKIFIELLSLGLINQTKSSNTPNDFWTDDEVGIWYYQRQKDKL